MSSPLYSLLELACSFQAGLGTLKTTVNRCQKDLALKEIESSLAGLDKTKQALLQLQESIKDDKQNKEV